MPGHSQTNCQGLCPTAVVDTLNCVLYCSFPLSPQLLNVNQSHGADRQPVWQFCVLHLQVSALKTGLAGCISFALADHKSLLNKQTASLHVHTLAQSTLTSWILVQKCLHRLLL